MAKKNDVIKLELTEEELKEGCKKKVYVNGDFVEVDIPKNSNENDRVAVEVEEEDGKKKKYFILLVLLLAPIGTKGADSPIEDSGMKPRKKGMKYKSPKKNISKVLFTVGGGAVVVIIAALLLLQPKNNNKVTKDNKKVLNSNSKHVVSCDFYFNENGDDIWVPKQEFHYEFLFSADEKNIENIHLIQKYGYNTGSYEERKVFINENTFSVVSGGTDEEIKQHYFSQCDTCTVSGGVMTNDTEMELEEFMEYSNLRNDSKKSLMNNLMDTFNIASSCDEGYYAFIPYTDTVGDYCPTENFRSSCSVKDAK